ncbi:MAG: hypothetical protein ACRD1V_19510 [Vicinamibacterales bacterium]
MADRPVTDFRGGATRAADRTAGSAFRAGLRQVAAAPAVLAGTCALLWAISLPLAIASPSAVASRFAASVTADMPARGATDLTAVASTFTPSNIGFGPMLMGLAPLASSVDKWIVTASAMLGWFVVWSFLSGGILDRYARARPTRTWGFFGACGAHAGAMLRLGVVAFAGYALLFVLAAPPLLRPRANASPGRAFGPTMAFAVFLLLLTVLNLVIDYARVRIVVEDRRSAIGALLGAVRFLRRHPWSTGALYGIEWVLVLLVAAGYFRVAPSGPALTIVAVVAAWIFILARQALRLTFYASETVLFQARLAHAGYTALPVPAWPESPAAEAIADRSRLP